MHLAERLDLPAPYQPRPYRGPEDHTEMTRVLAAYRNHHGEPDIPTVESLDVAYAHLDDCDPETDIYVVEDGGGVVVGYGRASFDDLTRSERDLRDCIVFAPTMPERIGRALFDATVRGQESHMQSWIEAVEHARFRAYASHAGTGLPATGEAAWLEALGYVAAEWGASLVRPNLDDIPARRLPDGVVLRPVAPEHLRPIIEAHLEAFRGEWDFGEPTANDVDVMLAEPHRDESLWKVAWAGDTVVGQVKSYINPVENAERGYQRGYTEEISVHHDWRNRGIAGALLAMSLVELRDRGITEAALGVDTNNPGGAFQLYTGLGFELQSYEAVYTRPAD